MTTQTLKSILMPVAMVIGALLCRPLALVESWTGGALTPTLIAAMLFITFCKVDIRAMRLSTIHLWMLAVQFLGSIAIYHIIEPLFGSILAEGAMICVLAPIAMAAVVTSVGGITLGDTGRCGHNCFVLVTGGIDGLRLGVVAAVTVAALGTILGTSRSLGRKNLFFMTESIYALRFFLATFTRPFLRSFFGARRL